MTDRRVLMIVALLPLLSSTAMAEMSSPSFDSINTDPSTSFSISPYVQTHKINHTEASRAIPTAQESIVQIIVAVKRDDVPDSKLPLDPSKIVPWLKANAATHLIPGQGAMITVPGTKLGIGVPNGVTLDWDEVLASMGTEGLAKFLNQLPREKLVMDRSKLPRYERVGAGSGFIINAGRMLCITNAHVAEVVQKFEKENHFAPELHIKLYNDPSPGEPTKNDIVAKVGTMGVPGKVDIAILEIPQEKKDGSPWAAAVLGDSSKVQLQDPVVAMGFPFGGNFSAPSGHITAITNVGSNFGDSESAYVKFFQTDAAINPGNSGGPLETLNDSLTSFEVIGMNTAIYRDTQTGSNTGIGYAIASNDIKRAVKQYLNTGSIDVGFIGMKYEPGELDGPQENKVVVKSVDAGGPAEKAGLVPGDVITKIDGRQLFANGADAAILQLSQAIKAKDPGESIPVTVVRSGTEKTFIVTVEKEPKDQAQNSAVKSAKPK